MWDIHELHEEDLKDAARLEADIFPDPWSVNALRETFEHKNSIMFGVFTDKKLVGYLIVYYVLDEAEIARIAVASEYRREGAASHMLLGLENTCEEKGIKKLMLDVRESNEAALSFYKDYGFAEDGIRKNYYTNPDEDAVLMSRTLGK